MRVGLEFGSPADFISDSYGIWYSWILLLAVIANCFASHSNLEAVRSGLEIIIRGPTAPVSGSLECVGVPLHERYRNTNGWVRWLHREGVDLAWPEGIWSYNPFWPNCDSNRDPRVCPICLFFKHFYGRLMILPDYVCSRADPCMAVCAILLQLCGSPYVFSYRCLVKFQTSPKPR